MTKDRLKNWEMIIYEQLLLNHRRMDHLLITDIPIPISLGSGMKSLTLLARAGGFSWHIIDQRCINMSFVTQTLLTRDI